MMKLVPATTNQFDLDIVVCCFGLVLPNFVASHNLMKFPFPSPFLTMNRDFIEFHHDGNVSVRKPTTALKNDATELIILLLNVDVSPEAGVSPNVWVGAGVKFGLFGAGMGAGFGLLGAGFGIM